jgi:DsbE subfamily thiol:disulfide oxidoreductase
MKQRIIPLFWAVLSLIATVKTANATDDIPRRAPDCALTALNATQQPLDLQRYKGQVLYVDFWASWCLPCVKSFPFMNRLTRNLKARGLQVIGVNLDEKAEDAQQFLKDNPAAFTIANDTDGSCATKFGVKGMPTSFLVDRKGMIRHVHLGFRPGEAEEFRVLVERLLDEQSAHQ